MWVVGSQDVSSHLLLPKVQTAGIQLGQLGLELATLIGDVGDRAPGQHPQSALFPCGVQLLPEAS